MQNSENQASELWFRESEFAQLKNQTLVKTIRLGDRTCSTVDSKGGYCEHKPIRLLIVKEDGSFLPWQAQAVVTDVELKSVKDLSLGDFQGCLEGLCSPDELLSSFKRFYRQDFDGSEVVSVITFAHVGVLNKIIKQGEGITMNFYQQLSELLGNNLLELKDDLFKFGPQYKPQHLTVDLLESVPLSLIIGLHPSEYALSPILWNAEAALTHRLVHFLPADITLANLSNLFKLFDLALEVGSEHFRVLTITNPHKVEAYKYFVAKAAERPGKIVISEDAIRIGATNQILIGPDDVFHVINSDGRGMANAVESFMTQDKLGQLAGNYVAVLGAGGAGRGIVYELAKRVSSQPGGCLTVFNRTLAKAEDLVDEYKAYFPDLILEARGLDELTYLAANYDVVVSSLTEGDPLLDNEAYTSLRAHTLIVDAKYENSVFATNAAKSGRVDLSVHDGAGMVVEGYKIPSQELADLWGYKVPEAIYVKIAELFHYKLLPN